MKPQRSWTKIVLVAVLIIVAFGAGYLVQNFVGTGFAVQEQGLQNTSLEIPERYSWTFALCTVEGRCMDVAAECNGTQVLNVSAVTEIGRHQEGWQDPRGGNPSVCPWN